MAFDDQETTHLIALWAPLLPAFSPLIMAILGTTVIVGGKVGLYASEKRKQKKLETQKIE
ncbi:MAG: hypothetical protein DDT40_01838 [candidate division WS2 bacterium]|nr:hypothetical protein [Candidatus Psychracetigena formicireducens]